MGSLAPPVLKAVTALLLDIPQTSNKTVPALTLMPQCETIPLPLPILTSVGFVVIGTFGKIRIHNFPFRLSFLTIACLAASICLAVMVPDFVAFKPRSPNCNLFKRKLYLCNFPFCIFLYLVFLGCNSMNFLFLIFTYSNFYPESSVYSICGRLIIVDF